MKRILLFLVLCLTLSVARAQLNKPYFFVQGRALIVDGKYKEAIEMLNMLLRSETKEYEGYFLRGVAKYNLDDLLGAEADFSRAIEENLVYTGAYQYRAITRSRLGKYSEALADYAQAVDLRPSQASTYFSRGVTLFLNQQFEKSVEDFSKFLRTEKNNVQALTNRGTAYLYLKDTVKAYADFDRAVAVNPLSYEGYMRRGLLKVNQQKFAEGIADLDRAIECDSTLAIAYFFRGVAKASSSRPVEALSDFDRSISYDSTNSVAYFNRGILRSQIGDYNRAIEDYDRVARANPGNVLVVYNRAMVKAQLGDYRSAAADYTRAIELYSDFANAYLYRSRMRAMMSDLRGAESDRKIAEAKIDAYRERLKDSSFSAYADTSRQFDRLMSFDADFGQNELQSISGDVRREVQVLPMFRMSVTRGDTSVLFNPREYKNSRLAAYQQHFDGYYLGLTNYRRIFPEQEVEGWDQVNAAPETWEEEFLKGITQSLLNQYTSAVSYYTRSLRAQADNPFAYLNRAVTEAEMIEFISSLESATAMPTITIGNSGGDPAANLVQNPSNRKYDYSAAIADLKKAAEQMPELPHIYYNLGNLYYMSGDMPAAIEQYTKAIELFPYFAEAYFNRGVVQIFLRDTQKGCYDISKAGELGLSIAYEVLKRSCVKL